MVLFFSPLEQFNLLPVIPVVLFADALDLSLTNAFIIATTLIFFVAVYIFALYREDNSVYIIPNKWQALLEMVQDLIYNLVSTNINGKDSKAFAPVVFSVFLTVFFINVIGLVPYSFTLTSHICATLALSLALFIGINIICIKRHGIKFFTLFLPPGTPLALALLLIPIELISYVFKPISLSIRLFANLMAGHTLLKVIAGFAYLLVDQTGVLFVSHYVPLLIISVLYVLELAVALIQSFVFSILICIYINDALNLH